MDNFEKKIRDSKNVIKKDDSNSLSPNEIYSNAKNVNKFNIRNLFTPRLIMKYLILLLAVLISFTGGYLISKDRSNINDPIIINDNDKERLPITPIERIDNTTSSNSSQEYLKFESEEDLIKYLSTNKSSNTRNYTKNGVSDEDLVLESVPAASDIDTPTSTYKTNVQVEGVDEADTVKVIGNKIFYIPSINYSSNNKVHMFEEVNDKLYLRQTINYGKKEQILKTVNGYNLVQVTEKVPLDLYVTDKYLIVRVSKYEYKYTQDASTLRSNYSSYDFCHTTQFEIYDINTLKPVTVIDTSGYNVSTRLINNTLYIINNYYDYLYNTKSFYYFPFFYIDDVYYETSIDRIYYPKHDDYQSKTYLSIYKIYLDEEIKVEDLHILSSNANNIYASHKNIYLINSYETEVINGKEYQYIYPTSVVTVVNINDNLNLLGTFIVKGRIDDKYWIDEKDNFIRVVSTGTETINAYIEQKYFYASKSIVFNYLTIFEHTDDGFIERSKITEGIGKEGESIKSARFNGDVVTVVTFRQTDPLYYIDISDPNNPKITSAFEISGFSVYQHPYKDNLVIGFGYEADSNGRTTGYKITLFDIGDKENITSVGSSFIINYNKGVGKYSQVYYYTPEFFNNPKALFVNLDNNMFGFRILSGQYYSNNTTRDYKYYSEYLVFTIDETSPNPFKIILQEKYSSDNYSDQYNKFDRMVFIGNNYYLLSKDMVHSYIYNDGVLIDKTKFDLS